MPAHATIQVTFGAGGSITEAYDEMYRIASLLGVSVEADINDDKCHMTKYGSMLRFSHLGVTEVLSRRTGKWEKD
jgi:hypothetical protein